MSEVSTLTTFYMIHCIYEKRSCYYTRGIHITNIHFHHVEHVSLEKITLIGRYKIIRNLFPAFVRFQNAWKRRYKWIHTRLRALRQRELTGSMESLPYFLEGL
jgi:hypothetical protein